MEIEAKNLLIENIISSSFKLTCSCFAAQCTPIYNSINLPVFKYKTEHRLNYFEVNEEDIYLIIKKS